MVLGNFRNYNNTAVGDEVALMLSGKTSWATTQKAGQSIVVGSGAVEAGAASRTIRLVGMAANLKFQAPGLVGALNVI